MEVPQGISLGLVWLHVVGSRIPCFEPGGWLFSFALRKSEADSLGLCGSFLDGRGLGSFLPGLCSSVPAPAVSFHAWHQWEEEQGRRDKARGQGP